MALKSATTTLATIQMRRGSEENFDPDQMTTGEWAVSTDSKKVWMCFTPGLVLRMATYEAFEKDMEEIRRILVEAQDIQLAIQTWYKLSESYAHGGTGTREGEDTDNAKYYADQAKISADNAEAVSGVGIMSLDKAGIGKPDGTTIAADEDGTLRVIGGGAASGDFASKAIYGDNAISLGRKEGSAVGINSIAFGRELKATGKISTSFGSYNEANGENSFVAGYDCFSESKYSSAIGEHLHSLSYASFSEGSSNISAGLCCHVEGSQNISGAKYIFKVKSYETSSKKFIFDNTFFDFSDIFSFLTVGTALFIPNAYYFNDSIIFTVSSIGDDGKSVIVNEPIPTSNFKAIYATILSEKDAYYFCHTEGRGNICKGYCAHAEGFGTKAIDSYAHAEGIETQAEFESHAEGYQTIASGIRAHAEGYETVASGNNSHAEGRGSTANGINSHAAGYGTIAKGENQTVIGRFNTPDSISGNFINPFVVGNGTSYDSTSNAFRVNSVGAVYAKGNYNSSGADYAEFIRPWADGNPENEDRVGYFVTIKDGYLYKAEKDDYIVGITSGNPSVVGNSDEEYYWRWERDEFNRIIYEENLETAEKMDEDGRIIMDEETNDPAMVETGNVESVPKQREDYDASKQITYIERKDRSEWDYVGMLGVLPVRDDGTCEVGRFCKCADGGIATLATERGFDTYMVIDRISDNIVSVVLK